MVCTVYCVLGAALSQHHLPGFEISSTGIPSPPLANLVVGSGIIGFLGFHSVTSQNMMFIICCSSELPEELFLYTHDWNLPTGRSG